MADFIILQAIGFLLLSGILFMIIQNMRKERDIFTYTIVIILLSMLVIDIFPFEVARMLKSVGFARPLDAFMVMMAGISLLLGLKIYTEQKKMRKEITKIVKKVAEKD